MEDTEKAEKERHEMERRRVNTFFECDKLKLDEIAEARDDIEEIYDKLNEIDGLMGKCASLGCFSLFDDLANRFEATTDAAFELTNALNEYHRDW